MMDCKISICIATFNRGFFLKQILKSFSLYTSLFSRFEIVLVDGGSTDDTEYVVKSFSKCGLDLNYIRLSQKGGVDKDFDIAVRNSKFKYCWLLPDDDLIVDNALEYIFSKIHFYHSPDVLVLNSFCFNYDFDSQLNSQNIQLDNDIFIDSFNFQNILFEVTDRYLSYIGAIVIKRELWIDSFSFNYFNSRFIHLGVLSEIPLTSKILICAQPIVKIRLGNAEWAEISFYIWFKLWPNILSNFTSLNFDLKKKMLYKSFKSLLSLFLYQRALGHLNFKVFRSVLFKKESILPQLLGFSIICCPSFILRYVYFLRYKLSNDLVGLYNISSGRFTNNLWKSKL